jgi:hypothetical protein
MRWKPSAWVRYESTTTSRSLSQMLWLRFDLAWYSRFGLKERQQAQLRLGAPRVAPKRRGDSIGTVLCHGDCGGHRDPLLNQTFRTLTVRVAAVTPLRLTAAGHKSIFGSGGGIGRVRRLAQRRLS